MQGTYQACDSKMTGYLKLAKELKDIFEELEIKQITREENMHVDSLDNLGLTIIEPKVIPIVYLKWLAVWK